MHPLSAVELTTPGDVERASQATLELGRLMALGARQRGTLAESVRALAVDASGGRISFWLRDRPLSLRVIVENDRAGVTFTEETEQLDARAGARLERLVARRLAHVRDAFDEINVDVGTQDKTRIELGVTLPAIPLPSPSAISAALHEALPPDPVVSLRAQNRMLRSLLDELREERRRALTQRELIEVLLAQAPVSVWQADEDGNRAPVTVDGPSASPRNEELTLPYELVHPDDRQSHTRAWRDLIERGEPYQIELRVMTSRGYRWVLERAREVDNLELLGARYVGTTTDIDDAKRRALEAERLADLRERMVGVVGHDLRSPLGALQLGLGTVKLLTADPEVIAILDPMQASVTRASRLVGDLLDYVRGSAAGGFPIVPVPSDLRDLAERQILECHHAFPNVVVELASREPTTHRFDPDRLGQALSNLLRNACTHGDGKVQVTVGSGQIVVSNSGVMPPREREHLFEPFHHRQGRDGLGLGLWITRSIVEGHGGVLRFSSEDGATRFTITLPEEVPTPAAEPAAREAPSPVSPDPGVA